MKNLFILVILIILFIIYIFIAINVEKKYDNIENVEKKYGNAENEILNFNDNFININEKKILIIYADNGEYENLTSNIYMAEILSENSNFRVNIIINSRFIEKFYLLIKINDRIQYKQNEIQFIIKNNNVNYYINNKNKDDYDNFINNLLNNEIFSNNVYYFSFSFNDKTSINSKFNGNVLLFNEFSGDVPVIMDIVDQSVYFMKKEKTNINTGFISNGIYIHDKIPKNNGKYDIKLLDEINQYDYIGYIYVFSLYSAVVFLDILQHNIASLLKNKKCIIYSSVNIKSFIHYDLIDKIIIKPSIMSFNETKYVISKCNIPILVSGDVSLSLAIDFEKNFIYENLVNHKYCFSDDIEALIGANYPSCIDVDVDGKYHSRLYKNYGKHLSFINYPMNYSYFEAFNDKSMKIFINTTVLMMINDEKYLSKRIENIRKEISLPEKIKNHINNNKIDFLNIYNYNIFNDKFKKYNYKGKNILNMQFIVEIKNAFNDLINSKDIKEFINNIKIFLRIKMLLLMLGITDNKYFKDDVVKLEIKNKKIKPLLDNFINYNFHIYKQHNNKIYDIDDLNYKDLENIYKFKNELSYKYSNSFILLK